LLIAMAATARAQGSWEGPYRPISPDANPDSKWHHCCEIAHVVLIGKPGSEQGKVLIIQGNGRRWIWNPAAPSSVSQDTPYDVAVENLFCACHSVDAEGDIVVHGGHRRVPGNSAGTPPPNFQNFGYYYPGSVRMPNGLVLSAGGGSSPLTTWSTPNTCCDVSSNYFVNGWQYFDPAADAWVGATGNFYFPGLPSPHEFNYYPLLTVMPGAAAGTGFVFASVVTNNRSGNYVDVGYTPVASPSASMPLTGVLGSAAWAMHSSQITKALAGGGSAPRNLYYPNGFLWPLHLDHQGLPQLGSVRRFVALGGCDQNEYLSGTQGSVPGHPVHPDGGRPPLDSVYSIDAPDAGGTWTDGVLPGPSFPRIYGNAVLLPDEQLFFVGGAHYDFLPYRGQGDPRVWARERKAAPIFVPEMLDLTPGQDWVPCKEHVSPRLYHSIALLLPDGRVLVGGGYRGVKHTDQQTGQELTPILPEHFTYADWKQQHSNFEIFSPDYLSAGPRPEILTTPTQIGYGEPFEVTVALPGSAAPAAAIGSICLMSPGSVTHHFDWDQRFVGLSFTVSTSHHNTRLVVTPPANPHLAPPGWYMLFVKTDPAASGGVRIPSIAKFVRLR
jgi:hypothetical protein